MAHELVSGKAAARAAALELFQRVELSGDLYDRQPGELSGGQAQRALIARSLTVSPRLLIADEATSMLDVSTQAQIVRMLLRLMEQDGLSVLLISHDTQLVEAVSNRIYHLSDGTMTEIEQT